LNPGKVLLEQGKGLLSQLEGQKPCLSLERAFYCDSLNNVPVINEGNTVLQSSGKICAICLQCSLQHLLSFYADMAEGRWQKRQQTNA